MPPVAKLVIRRATARRPAPLLAPFHPSRLPSSSHSSHSSHSPHPSHLSHSYSLSPVPPPKSPLELAVRHLARLLAAFPHPRLAVEAYLAHPLPGLSLRPSLISLIQHSRNGHSVKIRRLTAAVATLAAPATLAAIARRAQRLLRWLDGADPDIRDPFHVLGLGAAASPRDIVARYRDLSKRLHPDRHTPSREDYWRARQSEINHAYRILLDPAARAQRLADIETRKLLLRRLWEIEESWGV